MAVLSPHQPDIFNSDLGAQFTAHAFTSELAAAGIRISMDGRGRYLDNIFVERLWRSVQHEDVYLKEYATVPASTAGLDDYFRLYNDERPHQSLQDLTPAVVYRRGCRPLVDPSRSTIINVKSIHLIFADLWS
ncbi:MAG: transposase [Chloroflexi bacterium]|nr:transposase [Chloroflexota bacterium]